jgi:5-methylcytosine-specific restriction enzyme subunit McrC
MNSSDTKILEAQDCSRFVFNKEDEFAIQHFVHSVSKADVLYFSKSKLNNDESLAIAEYNFSSKEWRAGRFVGESAFSLDGKNYKVIIKPRFGELFLFKMLEEIFNVKLTESSNSINYTNNFEYFIKKIISFLWLNILAKSNIHGLPRNTNSNNHQGKTLKGRIDIVPTIKRYYTKDELVSNYRTKEVNDTIAQILFQAYNILVKDYYLGTNVNIPSNAKDAITQLEILNLQRRIVSKNEYSNIQYKNIYQSFKPLVDFSWDLIQKKTIANNVSDKSNSKGYSFFIDMAEIWELYLKSILKKFLHEKGWVLRDNNILTYSNNFFVRKMIPDLVFQRNNDVIVFDAKYKRMMLDNFDVDRSDFFQIHTYIHYFENIGNVVLGGLLYPFSAPVTIENKNKLKSDTIFGILDSNRNTKFIIDGIDCSALVNNHTSVSDYKKMEIDFINRISEYA